MCLVNPTPLDEESVIVYKVMEKVNGHYLPLNSTAKMLDLREFKIGEVYKARVQPNETQPPGFHAYLNKEEAKQFFDDVLYTGFSSEKVKALLEVKLSGELLTGQGEGYKCFQEVAGSHMEILNEISFCNMPVAYGGSPIK
jgi:hypothetical protein